MMSMAAEPARRLRGVVPSRKGGQGTRRAGDQQAVLALVGCGVLGDGVTSMIQWPASPSGTVKWITEFRPSEALPAATATRLPFGS